MNNRDEKENLQIVRHSKRLKQCREGNHTTKFSAKTYDSSHVLRSCCLRIEKKPLIFSSEHLTSYHASII